MRGERDATLVEPRDTARPEPPGMAMDDAIVVAGSDGEENSVRPLRRTRKPSAKAVQNEQSQDSLDAALMSTKRSPGSVPRGTTTNDVQKEKNGTGGEEQAVLGTSDAGPNEGADWHP
jgi:hypothetical protein